MRLGGKGVGGLAFFVKASYLIACDSLVTQDSVFIWFEAIAIACCWMFIVFKAWFI
jgi:hypothetical protein